MNTTSSSPWTKLPSITTAAIRSARSRAEERPCDARCRASGHAAPSAGRVPIDRRSAPGCAANVEAAAERGEPVGDPLDPGAVRGGSPDRSHAVVGRPRRSGRRSTVRAGSSRAWPRRTSRRSASASRHEKYTADSISCGVATDAVRVHVDGDDRLPRLRVEGGGEALDPPGAADRSHEPGPGDRRAPGRIALQLRHHPVCARRVAVDHRIRRAAASLERDQLLLRAIVDVPLQLLRRSSCAATIRRRESRRSSISRTLRSTSPACAAMSRMSFAFVGFIGSAGRERDRERPEEVPLVPYLERVFAVEGRQLVAPYGHARGRRRVAGPGGFRTQLDPDAQPDPRGPRTGRLGEELGHPGEDVLRGVGLPDAFRELGQDLVRGRSLSVDDPVRPAACPGPDEVKPIASSAPIAIVGRSTLPPTPNTASGARKMTSPTTIMNPATRRPYCTVFLMTTSRSQRPYLRIATVQVTGIPMKRGR